MYYIVSEICIGGCFQEDCFYCYSQKVISAVANKSIIFNNLIKDYQIPTQTKSKKCKVQLNF